MEANKKNPAYDIEDEKILAYSRLSDAEKLRWLEEALMLHETAFSDEEKIVIRKMRDYV